MRILHIDRQRGWTGQTNRTLTEVRSLNQAGVFAALVAHRGGPLAERARQAGVDVVDLPLYGSAMWRSIPAIVAAIRRHRIDVLHCHGPRDHLLSFLIRVTGLVPRLVRTRHNHHHLNSGLFSKLLFVPCARTICVSEYVARVCVQEGFSPRRIRVVPDAVDTDRLAPAPRGAHPALHAAMGIRDGDFVVGHVSTLSTRKAPDVILKAFAQLVRQNPGPPPPGPPGPPGRALRCVMVGGSGGAVEPCKTLARELGILDQVAFTGFRDDVPALLNLFDLFVHPSRDEAMGTAVLEAMSAGLPVIGTDVGGIPETFDAASGVLVPVDDVAALAGAMDALFKDDARRRAMGAAGRQRALTQFSVARLAERSIAVYREILNG